MRRDRFAAAGAQMRPEATPQRPQRLDRYIAAALQMPCDSVHVDRDRESASLRMRAAIRRIEGHVRGAKRWIGADLKLVVLPEYVLTGPPGASPFLSGRQGGLDIDGPEYAALAAIAAEHEVFLAGNAYELDPHFPASTSNVRSCWTTPAGGFSAIGA